MTLKSKHQIAMVIMILDTNECQSIHAGVVIFNNFGGWMDGWMQGWMDITFL
jgi:hypothetical protein